MTENQLASEATSEAGQSADKVVDISATEVTDGEQLLFLLPEEVNIPLELDVRPWSNRIGLSPKELESLENFVQSIRDEGQLEPVKVRYNQSGGYDLVYGRRRHTAISLINAEKKPGEPPLRMKAIVTREDPVADKKALGVMHRQAMFENLHRDNMSPMDMTENIRELRSKFRGSKSEITKKIALYLRISAATVTQYERLLKLSEDYQLQIHDGTISRDAAFALESVEPDKRDEVIGKAKELQRTEEASASKSGSAKKVPRKTGTVKSRHIKKASRQVDGASTKPQARTKKDIVEFFDALEGSAYGHRDGVPHRFVREFKMWCAGGSSDRRLEKLWGMLCAKADKGKPPEKQK